MGKSDPVAPVIKTEKVVSTLEVEIKTEREDPESDDEQGCQSDDVDIEIMLEREDSSSSKDTKTLEQEKLEKKSTCQIEKHYTNIMEILVSSNATPIRQHSANGYMCCSCDKSFLVPADLKKHTIESHENVSEAYFMKKRDIHDYCIKLDITSLHCNICKKDINTLEELMEHLRAKHDRTLHMDIKNHIMPFKFNTDTLECFMCKQTFNKFKTLLEHTYNVHYRNYTCDVCDASFVSYGRLLHHSYTHKTGIFKCEHCSKVFDTKLKMRQHLSRTHLNVTFKCEYCDEEFTGYTNREAHLNAVHGMPPRPPLKCQVCQKEFPQQKDLTKHVKRDHLLERPHGCSECDKKFFRKDELKCHMLKHSGVRSHKCPVCLKSFKRKWTLKEHMRIHEDDRRFKCDHCEQAYVHKCSWKEHMRLKHGEIV